MSFEFGECHFDWIEVGAVCGQKQEPTAAPSQGFCRARAFVSGQIVEDHNGSGIERRGQLCLDICVEGGAVHGPLDHPWRDQGVLRQARNKGLGPPLAKGCCSIEPLADRGTSAQPREVCLDRRLVNEDQPAWLLAHAGLAACDPIASRLAQRGPVTFRRDQSFFYMTARRVRGRGAAKRVEH